MAKMSTYLVEEVSPIMMHNPAGMQVSSSSGLSVAGSNIPTPEEEAAASRYLNKDGTFFEVPTQHFKAALVKGSKGRRLGKQSAGAILKWAVFCAEPFTPLLDKRTGEPMPADQYSIDSRRVILRDRNNKSIGIVRSRALVSNWACKIVLEVDDFIGDQDAALLELFNLGGRAAGVFDYRPERGGPFGRFKVSLIESSANGDQKSQRGKAVRNAKG